MENSNDIFGRILGSGPSQNTVFLLLRKMKEEGRLGEVITECLKALDFYPNDVQLRTLLAETYLEMGFIGQAERELDRITSDIKNLISAYKLQADIYTRQKRHEEASEALKRYLALNPDDREALDLLAKIKPVEEEPVPKAPEIPEEAGPALEEEFEEEIKEEIITEPPEIPEEVVLAAEEEIKEEPAPPELPEEVADLATPTLAEIYYNQGQMDEAINTYEKVILNNPEDKSSIERLEALKAQIAEKPEVKATPEDAIRARTEKMITVLEGWLERIQESGHA
ncbi:MAG: tetratricopeptide repeat protein [Deltaproteobacteria bacterium]|nr:tetratricopeptide repeat protein [Deltaproteobacteria bacterium]MBW2119380.1 tetratricopeptide repeat protein [Deltaproteobacteria bacterium]MBW2344386.1 tetratricopeptide repeat protein [Deltaproteobacteria bacterium]